MDAVRTAGLLLSVAGVMSSVAGPPSNSSTDCSYVGLLTHLGLTSSNVTLQVTRPVKNWSTATVVQLDMLIYGILEVDEKLQTVTNHIWVSKKWTNEFMTWEPSDFCGIQVVTVPRSSIWVPDIGIQEDTSDTGSLHKSPYVSIYYNGTMEAEGRQRLTYTCQLRLKMFPFDMQTCQITFMSQSYQSDSLTLETMFSDITLSTLSERIMITHGEWGLTNITTRDCDIPPNRSETCKLMYKVIMERKPLLYVINFIVPLFYLLVLDLISFFISEARGEKMSFKITILLSISVLLLILKDLLPSTEDDLPHIASYCIGIFALVGLSVVESMVVTFLVDLDDYCAAVKNRSEEEEDIPVEVGYFNALVETEEKVQEKQDNVVIPLESSADPDVLKRILEEVKVFRQLLGKKGKEKTKKRKYKHVAEVLDHIYFFFYFATVVVFLVFMYTSWMRNQLLD